MLNTIVSSFAGSLCTQGYGANFNFKCKKYRFATASYTEGLKVKCGVKEVETALLTNRAAAQFHVANYRSSLIDCRSLVIIAQQQ